MGGRRGTPEERFWWKVNKSAGQHKCWLWTGSIETDKWGGKRGAFCPSGTKIVRPPRFIMLLRGHKFKRGECVCHKCDNPLCVNPRHLFIGTHQDNMADMVNKMRHAHGVRCGRAKMTEENVREIRRSAEPARVFSKKFGVSERAVYLARNYVNWAYIKD